MWLGFTTDQSIRDMEGLERTHLEGTSKDEREAKQSLQRPTKKKNKRVHFSTWNVDTEAATA